MCAERMNRGKDVVVAIGIGLMAPGGTRAIIESEKKSYTLEFLNLQWSNLPDLYLPGFQMLAFYFRIHGFILFGKSLNDLSEIHLQLLVMRWRSSKFGPQRDFIRLVESLVIYSQPES